MKILPNLHVKYIKSLNCMVYKFLYIGNDNWQVYRPDGTNNRITYTSKEISEFLLMKNGWIQVTRKDYEDSSENI